MPTEQPQPSPRARVSPAVQVAAGLAIVATAIGIPLACGVSVQRIPAVIQCQVDALKILPSDPKQATVGDAIDLVHRIKACRLELSDAGG